MMMCIKSLLSTDVQCSLFSFAEAKSSTFAMSTSTYRSPAVSQRWSMRRSSGHVWRSPQRLWWDPPTIGHHFLSVLLKILQRFDLTDIVRTAHNSLVCFVVNVFSVGAGARMLRLVLKVDREVVSLLEQKLVALWQRTVWNWKDIQQVAFLCFFKITE